ncbi:MAG: helix-turn-helix transcriptional regulator [Hydrogenophilales bacterium]|nr:helix-turn-helix transcriptional regulator [Hydrogenophilales bacterium]
MLDRKLLGGLVHLHILHHACHEPIFGVGIMEELARHGYKLSPGTLYPILHGLEKTGYLISSEQMVEGRIRRTYVATEAGMSALVFAKTRVRELYQELFEEE